MITPLQRSSAGRDRRWIRAVGLVAALAAASACGRVRSCASGPQRPPGQFLYVVHDPPGYASVPSTNPHISTLRIDPATGALAKVDGGLLSAGAVGAFELSMDPTGRWFALAGSQLGLERVTASGALERVETPKAGVSSAFDARGRFFFLVTGAGIEVYPVDRRRGPDLSTPLHTAPGVIAPALATSPDGAMLYAAADQALHAYAVGERGVLTAAAGSPASTGVRALDLAVHPSGQFVLVLGEVGSDRRVAVLRTSAAGTPQPIAGSPFELGERVGSMTLSADGALLFLTDHDRHAIETFALDADGGPHRLTSTPQPSRGISTMRVDATNRYLYATSLAAVHAWTFDSAGTLTEVAGSPFAVGGRAGDMRTTPHDDQPLQAAALPAAGSFGAEPERLDTSRAAPSSMTIEDLVAHLSDPSDAARVTAVTSLAQRHDLAPAIPALVNALDDRYAPVRTWARMLLGPWALQHPDTIDDAVLDRIVNNKNGRGAPLDNASLTALHALIRRGAPASPYVARTIVNHGQLREEAIGALAALGPAAQPAVPELIRLLQDSQANRHAAYALGNIGPGAAQAVPELYGLVNHPSKAVATAARQAIERIRGGRQ